MTIPPPDQRGALTPPDPARAYNYAGGGKDNYAVDRRVADEIMGMSPDAARIGADNRAFLYRAVGLAVGDGVRQFIDIGAGYPMPPGGNVHEWAQAAGPTARTVYIDSNPAVVTSLQAQVESAPQVRVMHGDLTRPRDIMTSRLLVGAVDLAAPVAVILGAVLHFLPDDRAFAAVEYIRKGLAYGSYLIISHATADGAGSGQAEQVKARYAKMQAPLTLRTEDQIAAFFDGCRLAEPGIVNVNAWNNPVNVATRTILYGAAALTGPPPDS